ncbi:MAG: sigma-70 family RNA polymerase sigma factor [Candidatus Sulfotelmatobacter sp.]
MQTAFAISQPAPALPHFADVSSAASQALSKRVDDLILVQACKGGNIDAFEELVRRYQHKLLRVAQNITRNHEDAEEVVQESLLKAYHKLDQFRGNAKFSTWLFRINVNQSQMRIRKRLGARTMIFESLQTQNPEPACERAHLAPNPEELCQASERRRILMKASMILRPRLRIVFVLRDIEGVSIEQTARTLHLNQSAVKSRLWRARIQLRNQLSRSFNFREELIGV